MLKNILWKIGLLTLLFLIVGWLGRNIIITYILEKKATEANKAKVNIEGLNYLILQKELTTGRVQITDPDNTTMNLVEVKGISVKIGALDLLKENITIDELSLEDVQLYTLKKGSKPGVDLTPHKKPSASSENADIIPKESINREIKNIISTFDTRLSSQYEKNKVFIDTKRDYWDKKIKENNRLKKIEQLQAEADSLYEEIKSSRDILKILGKSKEIKSVLQEVKTLYKELEPEKEAFKADASEIINLSEEYKKTAGIHMEDIEELINLDPYIIGTVINDTLEAKLEEAVYKFTDSFKGLNEKIREAGKETNNSSKKILIKKLIFTTNIEGIPLAGEVYNLSNNTHQTKEPVDFQIKGDHELSKVYIQGFINPTEDSGEINLDLKSIKLSDLKETFSFGEAEFNLNQNLSIEGTNSTLTGDIELISFKSIDVSETTTSNLADVLLGEAFKNLKNVEGKYTYDQISGHLDIKTNLLQKLRYSLKTVIDSKKNLIYETLADDYHKKSETYYQELKEESLNFRDVIGEEINGSSDTLEKILNKVEKITGFNVKKILKKII